MLGTACPRPSADEMTSLWQQAVSQDLEESCCRAPWPRDTGRSCDIIAFLASPDARCITGQNIQATGGLFL